MSSASARSNASTWEEEEAVAEVPPPAAAPSRRKGSFSGGRKQSRVHYSGDEHESSWGRDGRTSSVDSLSEVSPRREMTPRSRRDDEGDTIGAVTPISPDDQATCSMCQFAANFWEALAATSGKDPAREQSQRRNRSFR